jgi:hypothetical protein
MSAPRTITVRDRRALYAGGVVLAGALLFRFAVPAWGALARLAEANQRSSDLLALAHHDAMDAGRMRDSLQARRARLATADSLMLPSGSPARVASELAASVRRSAADVGLELLNATTEADSVVHGPLQRARIRIDAQGDISGILQFLLLVEISPGLLDVTNLAITPLEPTGGDDRAEAIRLSLTIEGVALVGPSKDGGEQR